MAFTQNLKVKTKIIRIINKTMTCLMERFKILPHLNETLGLVLRNVSVVGILIEVKVRVVLVRTTKGGIVLRNVAVLIFQVGIQQEVNITLERKLAIFKIGKILIYVHISERPMATFADYCRCRIIGIIKFEIFILACVIKKLKGFYPIL